MGIYNAIFLASVWRRQCGEFQRKTEKDEESGGHHQRYSEAAEPRGLKQREWGCGGGRRGWGGGRGGGGGGGVGWVRVGQEQQDQNNINCKTVCLEEWKILWFLLCNYILKNKKI